MDEAKAENPGEKPKPEKHSGSKGKVAAAVIITIVVMLLISYGLHMADYIDLSELLKSIGLESLI